MRPGSQEMHLRVEAEKLVLQSQQGSPAKKWEVEGLHRVTQWGLPLPKWPQGSVRWGVVPGRACSPPGVSSSLHYAPLPPLDPLAKGTNPEISFCCHSRILLLGHRKCHRKWGQEERNRHSCEKASTPLRLSS